MASPSVTSLSSGEDPAAGTRGAVTARTFRLAHGSTGAGWCVRRKGRADAGGTGATAGTGGVNQSLFLTSVWLLMPWHADDSKGTTVDLPAEYFLMLPLVGHRRLFSDFQPDGSMFLRPLAKEDERLMQHFPTTDAGKMMAILHRSFRDLAPLSFQVRPSSQRFEPLATTPEVPGQDYRLFEERA